MIGVVILKSYATSIVRLEPKVYAVEGERGTSGEAIPCGSGMEPENTHRATNNKTLRRKADPIRSHQRADVACQSLNAKTIQATAPPQFRTKDTRANGNSKGDKMTGSFIARHRTTDFKHRRTAAFENQRLYGQIECAIGGCLQGIVRRHLHLCSTNLPVPLSNANESNAM